MPDQQLGPVVIGAREIYDAVMRLQGSVNQLASQLASMGAECDERNGRAEQRFTDHETRLRDGERLRWPLPAVSLIIALGALLIPLLPILAGRPGK